MTSEEKVNQLKIFCFGLTLIIHKLCISFVIPNSPGCDPLWLITF